MSSDDADLIRLRLRQELERLNLGVTAASKKIGEKNPSRMKDIVLGRQKCPIDLMGKLAIIGVDVFYVLTGEHDQTSDQPLCPTEIQLLHHYRELNNADQGTIQRVIAALAKAQIDTHL